MRLRPLAETDRGPVFEQTLARRRRGEVEVVVAELDGRVVGRMGLDFTTFDEPGVVELVAGHVDPAHRSRGIGTALIEHMERVAGERGYSVVELRVERTNERARELYARLGYELYAAELEERDGTCWRMRKQLEQVSDT